MSYFSLCLPINADKYILDRLDKIFYLSKICYNGLLIKKNKDFEKLINTPEYKRLYEAKNWKELSKLQEDNGFSKWGFTKSMQEFQRVYSSYVSSEVCKDLALRLWKAFQGKMLFDNKTHMKKQNDINTITDRSTHAFRFFKDNHRFTIPRINMDVPIKIKNSYEFNCIHNPDNVIKYCSIKRVFIRGKYKYYLLLTIEGKPALKRFDGELKHKVGQGDVGIDIGMQTIAITTPTSTEIQVLCDKIDRINDDKILLEEKMVRSLDASNPECLYNNGVRKKGTKLTHKSKNYKKLAIEHKEIVRREGEIRRLQHNLLALYILSLGDNIFVEKMDFNNIGEQFHKCRDLTRKLRTSIRIKAPSMLIRILDTKLQNNNLELHYVNSFKTKLSQFDHTTLQYIPAELNKRTKVIDGHVLQRDLYSSFLLMNTNLDCESINIEKCNNRFNDFLIAHTKEIERLKKQEYNTRSIGVKGKYN